MLLTATQASSVVIAGAGGFAIEVFDYLMQSAQDGGPPVAGFLDDSPGASAPSGTNLPILGTMNDYVPSVGQVVVVALGSVRGRRSVLERLWKHNIETPAFIAGNTIISPSAKIARGVLVCPFSVINRNAVLGEGAAVNVHCSVGHGAAVGAFSVLSPYAALNGDSSVGEECFLGTRSTIYPRIHIGNGTVVDSHTGVRADAIGGQMISSRGNYTVVRLRDTAIAK
jgi:hypothetical protein